MSDFLEGSEVEVLNYKITVEYDGTNYAGIQHHDGVKTIEGTVFEACKKFLGDKLLELDFCGRTDAGVHAKGQVFHLKTPVKFPKGKLRFAINYHLKGEQIVAVEDGLVPLDFHARFSCKERVYIYKILNRKIRSPILKNRAWHVPFRLDFEKLQDFSKNFIGQHNFAAFRAIGCASPSPIKTINNIEVFFDGECVIFMISARSFLYRMVRSIVGACVDYSCGFVDEKTILELLKNGQKGGAQKWQMAPAHGLYFLEAKY